MDDIQLRRSARIRAQVKSHVTSTCDQRVVKASDPIDTTNAELHDHKLKEEDHDDQAIPLGSIDEYVDTTHKHRKRSRQDADTPSEQLYGRAAEGALIPWGGTRMRKQPKIYSAPGSTGVSIKKEVAQPDDPQEDPGSSAKHLGHSASIVEDSVQLYARPAEGTMIPFGDSRTRKQPKIYPVSQRIIPNPKRADDGHWVASAAAKKIARQMSSIRKLNPGEPETHLKSYGDGLPAWYHGHLKRANSQKMFVLERTRGIEESCHAHCEDCPFETIEIAGSTGNIYNVTISHLTFCDCPVGMFTGRGQEKQCKHILYVLYHVLKAPDHLKSQPAFLTMELKELFANAPPLPTDAVKQEPTDGKRKQVEGECPICCMDFGEGDDVVWCKAACGNNLHKGCFDRWAQIKKQVTCPFCRSKWEVNEQNVVRKTKITDVRMPTAVGPGGYFNIYDQLDYSNAGS